MALMMLMKISNQIVLTDNFRVMGKEDGLKFANAESIKCLFLDCKNNGYVSSEFKKNLN